MNGKVVRFLVVAATAVSLGLTPLYGVGQQNNNTSSGQMKESGSEVKRAGQSMGQNVKHGRVVRGGKHFGRHIGHAGRHFGRGTKKAVKRAVS